MSANETTAQDYVLSAIALSDTIEAVQAARIQTICNAVPEDAPMHPLGIYCLHTGRRIGTLSSDAVWLLTHAMPVDTMEDDAILEELTTRALLCCRPSPVWSLPDTNVMKRLVHRDPAGSVVYYLSKAYSTLNHNQYQRDPNSGKPVKGSWQCRYAQADWNRERIELFHMLHTICTSSQEERKQITELAEVLLEADSAFGLTKHQLPTRGLDSITTGGDVIIKIIAHYRKALKKHYNSAIHRRRDGDSLSVMAFNTYKSPYDTMSERQLMLRKKAEKKAEKNSLLNGMFKDLMGLDVDEEGLAIAKALRTKHDISEVVLPETKIPVEVQKTTNSVCTPKLDLSGLFKKKG